MAGWRVSCDSLLFAVDLPAHTHTHAHANTSALKMTREPTGPPSSSSRLKSGPAVTTRCDARMYARCASLFCCVF